MTQQHTTLTSRQFSLFQASYADAQTLAFHAGVCVLPETHRQQKLRLKIPLELISFTYSKQIQGGPKMKEATDPSQAPLWVNS